VVALWTEEPEILDSGFWILNCLTKLLTKNEKNVYCGNSLHSGLKGLLYGHIKALTAQLHH
jgi:hypothetical protein